MKKYILIALSFLLLAVSCNPIETDPVDPTPPPVEKVTYSLKAISSMTLREKVGQMFCVAPELLDPNSSASKTAGASIMKETFAKYPCGGIILYAANIKNPDQIIEFNKYLHGMGNYPLIYIDEEGGTVARIGKNSSFNVPTYTSMGDVGASGDPAQAFAAGKNIGAYLFNYNFDVDLAPVADVNSNPDNPVIGKRSFNSDPQLAATLSSKFLEGLQGEWVEGCLKHFPGHGDTKTDSHYGYAETLKTWDQMLECEMIPFKKGIDTGTRYIMTAHISAPNVTGSSVPSTLSPLLLTDKLRGELGYKGIIITDGMGMGAITKEYAADDAAVLAIKAGCDIILGPADYFKAFDAVVAAVESGSISEARIDESVNRILTVKKDILIKRGQLAQ